MPAPLPGGKRRPTVGLLTSGFAYGPERRLFEGMQAAARVHGVNLLCFHGRRLNSPVPDDRRANAVYDLIAPANCDALIIWSGRLGQYVSRETMRDFCKRFELPVVTIGGEPFEGIPSVVFDFYGGMQKQMLHLVDHHGYRRIAFIRGLAGADEAEQRFQAYHDVLVERGIGVDPRLVIDGSFLRESGRRGVSVLLDERREKVDAIVTVNDEGALGALEELTKRRIKVPHEIALVGFDDDEAVKWTTPPLTTVRFCIDIAAEQALGMVLGLLQGDRKTTGEDIEILALEPVVRASCGCSTQALSNEGAGASGQHISQTAFVHAAVPVLARSAPLSLDIRAAKEWTAHIYDAFVADITSAKTSSLSTWQSILRESLVSRTAERGHLARDSSIAAELEATAWHDVLAILRSRVSPSLQLSQAEMLRADDLALQISRMIADYGQRLPTFRGWVRELTVWQVQETGNRLLHTFDVNALAKVATAGLPALGIRRFSIALHHENGPHFRTARRVATSRPRGASDQDDHLANASDGGPLLFRSEDLAPPGFFDDEHPFIFAVEPLIFDEHQLGFALFEIEAASEGSLVAALQKQLSAALEGALLVNQLEERATELERAHRVQEEQRQRLVVAERVAWLGRLTAGMAHQINTPVAAVRSSLSHLTDLVEEYRDSIDDPQVLLADRQELANDMIEAVTLAARAAESAAQYVAELKAQTRDLEPKARTVFDVVPVLRDTLHLVTHAQSAAQAHIEFRAPEGAIEIQGAPERIAQVLTNLVQNAIDAHIARERANKGGEAPEGAVAKRAIEVSLKADLASVTLEIVDQGDGIPREIMARIFEPMFSTRSFGQHVGLGLGIARDIVESELGGTLEITSDVGSGTTARVRLPRPSP